jgi:hypothetical protein
MTGGEGCLEQEEQNSAALPAVNGPGEAVDTEVEAEPKVEATTKRGGTTGASAITMSPQRTGNSSVLSGTSAAGKTTLIAGSPVACGARNRQAPNRANTSERGTCGGPDALKTTDYCGGAATEGRGRGGGDPSSPTNVTGPKLWATTCTSTPGEHDLRGVEADPEGPTSLARQSGRVGSSRPLERTSTYSEREADRPSRQRGRDLGRPTPHRRPAGSGVSGNADRRGALQAAEATRRRVDALQSPFRIGAGARRGQQRIHRGAKQGGRARQCRPRADTRGSGAIPEGRGGGAPTGRPRQRRRGPARARWRLTCPPPHQTGRSRSLEASGEPLERRPRPRVCR